MKPATVPALAMDACSASLTVHLPTKTKARIAEAAKAAGMTVSAFTRAALYRLAVADVLARRGLVITAPSAVPAPPPVPARHRRVAATV